MNENFPTLFIHPDGRMDRKNAAIYLGFSPKTLADWAVKAVGPRYALVGGRVFYFKSDLDAWVSGKPRLSGPAGRVSPPAVAAPIAQT
jgi:hypothetical protein